MNIFVIYIYIYAYIYIYYIHIYIYIYLYKKKYKNSSRKLCSLCFAFCNIVTTHKHTGVYMFILFLFQLLLLDHCH